MEFVVVDGESLTVRVKEPKRRPGQLSQKTYARVTIPPEQILESTGEEVEFTSEVRKIQVADALCTALRM